MSGNVHHPASAAEFDALLSSNANVVVDFYADWCPPCRAIAPVYSRLADTHSTPNQLAFVKINVDHVKDVAARYRVSAMPTFLFFEKGKPAPVDAPGVHGPCVSLTSDAKVEMIRGADPKAMTAVAGVLGARAKHAAAGRDAPSAVLHEKSDQQKPIAA